MKTNICQKLRQLYHIEDCNHLPDQRVRSEWTNENKCGFLLGVVEHGLAAHVHDLELLLSDDAVDLEPFIDSMYDYYIGTVMQNSKSCCTFSESWPSGSSNSTNEFRQRDKDHVNLKKTLLKRNKACLFCWYIDCLRVTHIIAKKLTVIVSSQEKAVFESVGLTSMHDIKNALLLCANCQYYFYRLEHYIDE
ncbi:hypothetical protein HDV03_001813, partial [Kappamyces sp. JEL0829]